MGRRDQTHACPVRRPTLARRRSDRENQRAQAGGPGSSPRPVVPPSYKQMPVALFHAETPLLSPTHPTPVPSLQGNLFAPHDCVGSSLCKKSKGLIFAIWMQRTETAPMGTGPEVRDSMRTQSPEREWDLWGTLKIA